MLFSGPCYNTGRYQHDPSNVSNRALRRTSSWRSPAGASLVTRHQMSINLVGETSQTLLATTLATVGKGHRGPI